jgi:hypothetical protein
LPAFLRPARSCSGVGAFRQDGTLRFIQPYLAYRSGAWSGEASLIYGHGDYDHTSVSGDGSGSTRFAALTQTSGALHFAFRFHYASHTVPFL